MSNNKLHNDPMIAIDRKLGYVQPPGSFVMVKKLD
jgi:hypothetical protein